MARQRLPRSSRLSSTHEATEDVFGAGAERNYGLNIDRRARAQGAGDLDRRARLTERARLA